MALVSSVDYPNKKIYLGILSVGISLDMMDVYREVRALRASTEGDRRYYPMIIGGGNIQKTATTYTSPYVQLLFGCEIIPYDQTQTLTLVRDTFSDDGRAGGECFNTVGFTSFITIVEAVEKVEVREIAIGGDGVVADKVYIDTEALVNGDGTAGTPFNNIGDTVDYAEANGIKQIIVYSEVTLDRNLKNFVITGIGAPVIDCSGHDLDKSVFSHCTMRGTYLGRITVQESVLDNNFWLNGFFEKSAINGDVICIDGGAVLLANCFSLMTGLTQPTLSLNGLGSSTVSVTGYAGTLTVKDVNNAADEVTLGVTEGKLILDTTCTAGKIAPSGMAYFIDNSNGSTVDTTGLISLTIEEMAKIERNRWRIDNNKLTIYEDDGVTVFREYNLKDQDGNPTETNPVERDPV